MRIFCLVCNYLTPFVDLGKGVNRIDTTNQFSFVHNLYAWSSDGEL
jgi:hypothetical protein